MTALVCIDTKIGTVRRYEREDGAGMNNVRCTHQIQVKDWPKFRAGEYALDPTQIARFRTDPEPFIDRA